MITITYYELLLLVTSLAFVFVTYQMIYHHLNTYDKVKQCFIQVLENKTFYYDKEKFLEKFKDFERIQSRNYLRLQSDFLNLKANLDKFQQGV